MKRQTKDNEATQRLTTVESPFHPYGWRGKREEMISPDLRSWGHTVGAGIVEYRLFRWGRNRLA